MRFPNIPTSLLLVIGLASCHAPSQTPAGKMVGDWSCGPTMMHGQGFDISIVTTTSRTADGRFKSRLEATVTQSDKEPVLNIDDISGTWKVDGLIYSEYITNANFVSSSDKSVTREQGQARNQRQLGHSRLYKSKILEIQDNLTRTIPMDSEYPEAVVELLCRRA